MRPAKMDSARIAEFIRGYGQEPNELLRSIREECERTGIPLVKKETAAFLGTVIRLSQPRRVLELGTAAGYSSIYMISCGAGIDRIDTIEDWEPRIPVAIKNIASSGASEKIRLITGDALEVMPELSESYDLVFIDAAKGQYPDYLKEAIRLTHKGSVILADNILQDGDILESKYIVERRDRTIHKRIREFLDELFGDDRFSTSLLPLGDGVTFSIRCK